MLIGIDNKKIWRVSYTPDGVTELNRTKMTLIDFAEWYERVKERATAISYNGVNSIIVFTEKRYFVVYIEE